MSTLPAQFSSLVARVLKNGSICSIPCAQSPLLMRSGAHHPSSSFPALPHSLDRSQAHSLPLQLPFLHLFLLMLRSLLKSSHFLTRSSQWKHLPHHQRLGGIRTTVVIAGVCGSVIHCWTVSLMNGKEEKMELDKQFKMNGKVLC